MTRHERFDPEFEWLDHVRKEGLVVARSVMRDRLGPPQTQTQLDTAIAAQHISADESEPALKDAWSFFSEVLNWPARYVAGAPGGAPLPDEGCTAVLPELDTHLEAHWAVLDTETQAPILLVRQEDRGIDPDQRNVLPGWEASPQHRFERLLRETGVCQGVLITDRELRLVYAPKGETAGWIGWPLHALTRTAGRPMLGGLKRILDFHRVALTTSEHRLDRLLEESRAAQAHVSEKLAEQVLGALHELMRGFRAKPEARELLDELARKDPQHVYKGLLTVLMRLVFVLYAEDRDLMPSAADGRLRAVYDENYSVRGLLDKLLEDEARYPDIMDQRVGAWGRLLALFRLIHSGQEGFVKARGGVLFDPDEFPFLEGRTQTSDEPRVLPISDGTILAVLRGLMMLNGERLSYKALDVEQIGSVYETVMGFTVETTAGPAFPIKAGKNNRTPVFVDLDALLRQKAGDRLKYLKEECKRANVKASIANGLKAAQTIDDLVRALDDIVDLRASPDRRPLPAGTPILQPTDERRGTGSHYTPRTLTEPIVRQALEPVFARLGEDATPDEVLDIKVCDPAMGSGAFLVEACRQLAARLTQAWARHPGARPPVPPDEDEDLLARRLVAQRCLYGVDRNPMATDLARLSLWLTTLAREHEFTFLDHALKSGDSLVGLTAEQIGRLTWEAPDAHVPHGLFDRLVRERMAQTRQGRQDIRRAPDDIARAVQEERHRQVEQRLADARHLGDALVATFFAGDKPRARKHALEGLRQKLTAPDADLAAVIDETRSPLGSGDHTVTPFHWQLEFPEVFDRENPGFDAIVGNPPFAGKNTMAKNNRDGYPDWLKLIHEGAHGNADLVAHFFRRSYRLLGDGGAFGLIASNTIAQGDTRETGLRRIIGEGGTIYRATRRLKWPGEAAVVVSVVHVGKRLGDTERPALKLDGRDVSRISAFLVDSDNDDSPAPLKANEGKAFQGSIVLGMGFTFDDKAAAQGTATSLAEMRRLIEKDPRNAERIKPFIGWEEVANHPRHSHRRYIIDFEDFPLRRESVQDQTRIERREEVIATPNYPNDVASDWPDLLTIVERLVKPSRISLPPKNNWNRDVAKRWWQFGSRRLNLYRKIKSMNRIIVTSSQASAHVAFAFLGSGKIFSSNLNVFALRSDASFAYMSSRVHEVWTRQFGSTVKDDPAYTIESCFNTFPFPPDFENNPELEEIGRAYHDHRADLMIRRDEGLTKTYNRFHDPHEKAADIEELRRLHAEMDRAVLRAYGWHDLADRAQPEHLTPDTEYEYAYQGRLFWPAEFRDEVLARLLDLNRERAAQEAIAGEAGIPSRVEDSDERIENHPPEESGDQQVFDWEREA